MRFQILAVAVMLVISQRAFAFGIDIGPVHVHGTKVKVGEDIDLKIVVDKLKHDDNDKDQVSKIIAHRKGDSDDKFEIKIVRGDLDEKSLTLLKNMKEDKQYAMRLKKLDEDWKLTRVREEDD